MRIVVYPHLLEVGGSQLNAIELAAAVRDLGHHVTVFAAETGPLADTVARLGLPLIIAPRHKIRPSLTIADTLRTLCRRERIDVVHGYEWPPCVEGFFGPQLSDGVTVGCTVMSMSVAPFIPSSVPLVVGTEQIAASVRDRRHGRVDVIEPPVDTTSNRPGEGGTAFRAQYGLGRGLTIVLVSRLAMALKLEGLERAIAAVDRLVPRLDVRLVIVGDGPAREHLGRAAEAVNGRSGRRSVLLTGELADPRPAYDAADVVLGMGGSALRAMAFAKPVVVLGERGFARLLTPESVDTFLWQGFYGLGDGNLDPSGLAQILEPLLQEPNRRDELGRFAYDLVTSRFSLLASAQRQLELYEAWVGAPVPQTRVLMEAARTAAQIGSYKVRRRIARWRGGGDSEDFNAVQELEKVARIRRTPPA